MKNYISFGIVWINLIISSTLIAEIPVALSEQEFEYITDFIVASISAEEVEKFLFLRTLNVPQKKKLLEKAKEIRTQRRQNVKLLNNPWDLAKITSGTVLTVYGMLMGTIGGAFVATSLICQGYEKGLKDLSSLSLAKTLGGLVSVPLSLGLGIFLTTNRYTSLRLYTNAKKIKEHIKGASVG